MPNTQLKWDTWSPVSPDYSPTTYVQPSYNTPTVASALGTPTSAHQVGSVRELLQRGEILWARWAQKHDQETSCATKIQCIVRGWKARQKLKNLRRLNLNTIFLQTIERQEDEYDAATLIQSAVRGWITRNDKVRYCNMLKYKSCTACFSLYL